ncbi:MAG: glycosyltransferase family 39 protein [Leptolyngbyaceae bacterium]|nr:glycosyltransferase family 39 protein [Leptolyngbyaceae bacterium]
MIDWDESLYLLIADKWLDGYPPYTVIWDNKPPGIYLLFALALAVFGHSVIAIRILACIAMVAASYGLYLVGGTLNSRYGAVVGILAGVFYAFAFTINGGDSANTEIFFIPFAIFAFYLLFSKIIGLREFQTRDYWLISCIGLVLGIGFEIKQVVLFDLITVGLILAGSVLAQPQFRQKYLSLTIAFLALMIGFILPFLAISLYFFWVGNFHEYFYANFTANKLRTVDNQFSTSIFSEVFNKLFDSRLMFTLCVLLLSSLIYLLIDRSINQKERWMVFSLLVWFTIILIGFFLVFRHIYPHYLLQLNPPLALASAYMVTRLGVLSWNQEGMRLRRRYFLLLLAVLLIVNRRAIAHPFSSGLKQVFYQHIKGIKYWQDNPGLVAEHLRNRMDENNYIYVVDDQPIIYFLAGAKTPSKYVFPSFLLPSPDLPNITGVKPLQELENIFRKNPVYIIKRHKRDKKILENPLFYRKLHQHLDRHYVLERTIGEVNLFRLKGI